MDDFIHTLLLRMRIYARHQFARLQISCYQLLLVERVKRLFFVFCRQYSTLPSWMNNKIECMTFSVSLVLFNMVKWFLFIFLNVNIWNLLFDGSLFQYTDYQIVKGKEGIDYIIDLFIFILVMQQSLHCVLSFYYRFLSFIIRLNLIAFLLSGLLSSHTRSYTI